MVYLIVPPIIIVVTIAILIVFLTRSLSPEKKKKGLILHNVKKDIKELEKEVVKKRKLEKKKKQNKIHNSDTIKKGNYKKENSTIIKDAKGKKKSLKNALNNGAIMTQGIRLGGNISKIVSLRKKSMISDKLGDGEDRDEEEMMLMKAIEEKPQDSKKYESLGDYYMEHEKFADARDCYKYVLRLDPKHKRAQVAMRNLDRVL
jgi:Sec-independent protein translocase protein TatA